MSIELALSPSPGRKIFSLTIAQLKGGRVERVLGYGSRASLLTIELGLSPSNIVSGGGLQVVGFKGFLGKGPGVH